MKKLSLEFIIIIVLLCVILLQRISCKTPVAQPGSVTTVRDTVWVKNDSIIYSKPSVIKTITIQSHDTVYNHYIPDTSYKVLVKQYQDVVNQLLAKNIHQDSIRIDTNGYVKITDTVQKNLIVGRSTEYNIKYPVIKETITIIKPPKNQLYIGGGVGVSSNLIANTTQLRTGLLFKNKKDQILGGSVTFNSQGQVLYGVESYWKINLKK